jgi:two-component system, LytTR family, sensor histidine kinase AlgZ
VSSCSIERSRVPSINQNAHTSALPNFRNLGIILRILVIVNVLAVSAAIVRASTLYSSGTALLEISVIVQPVLIATLLALGALNDFVHRLTYPVGVTVVVVLAVAITACVVLAIEPPDDDLVARLQRSILLTALTLVLLLTYFHLHGRALSPALSEARLQALQARIRPHFLYNSINAVLSLIRQDPRRAEAVLEDLAELFRVVMGDNRELSPISREIELCRQYLELEQLRLGDRLRVAWHIDKMPPDALMPPLVLQPLIENAVYHGIEPRVEPGEISIDIYTSRNRVHAVLRNPFEERSTHHSGNKMAIDNIRERLQLHFDAEASLETRIRENVYQVHIVLPYVKATA